MFLVCIHIIYFVSGLKGADYLDSSYQIQFTCEGTITLGLKVYFWKKNFVEIKDNCLVTPMDPL